MRLKEGVLTHSEQCPKGVGKPILYAMYLIADIMERTGEYTITSILDGKHGPNSLHYKGLAFDLRTRHLKDLPNVNMIARQIRDELGRNYDVVVESDHIHVEYDKKD